MRNFRKLDIWSGSIKLCKAIYLFSGQLPKEEQYGIVSQIKRASVSIPSNIAEGASRKSEKEYSRFLEIAIGSSFEVENLLVLTQELGFATNEQVQPVLEQLESVQKRINALISVIAKS